MYLRMITHRGSHEPDLIGKLAHLGGARQELLSGKDSRSEIRVSGPTEPATHRAPARDLNKVAAAHLGVFRNDLARRDEVIIELSVAFLLAHRIAHCENPPGSAVGRRDFRDPSVLVADFIETRYVKPRLVREPHQEVFARGSLVRQSDQGWHKHFT